MLVAGDEGFEPPIMEPESIALPLGLSPINDELAWLFYPVKGSECKLVLIIQIITLSPASHDVS